MGVFQGSEAMPSTASDLQQQGQKLYQKGDFKAAIQAFSEALNQRGADTVGLLDNRAATYSKLEQYDQARRDARNMIKQGKEDDRGYLRCAKVLLLEGKPDKALEVYAYGLKVLPNKHPRRQMVEQLHKKLQDRMVLNRKDPFTMLPFEVAAMVIQHFSFKQIVGILRVCKDWERFFGTMTHLWMQIDLSGARGKVPWTAVRTYIKRSKAMVTHATIKNLATASTPKTMEFLSRCPRLEHLELWVDYDYRIFFQTFKGCKQLKSLTLSPDIPLPHDFFERLLIELPRLERIALWSVKPSPYDLTASENWPKSLPNLKSITLATQHNASMSLLSALTVPGLGLEPSEGEPPLYPNLEELRLDWNPPRYQYQLLQPVGSLPAPMRRLDLRGLSVEPDFLNLLPDSLEYLCLQGGSSARCMHLDERQTPLSNLHTLIFRDTGWFSDMVLEEILCAKPRLRTVHLDQCFNFIAFDLVRNLEYHKSSPTIEDMTELNVSHMREVYDDVVQTLCTLLPSLKVLNVSYTFTTGCVVRVLADATYGKAGEGARLDRLIIRGCEGVSSDAVAYARDRGLEVIV